MYPFNFFNINKQILIQFQHKIDTIKNTILTNSYTGYYIETKSIKSVSI